MFKKSINFVKFCKLYLLIFIINFACYACQNKKNQVSNRNNAAISQSTSDLNQYSDDKDDQANSIAKLPNKMLTPSQVKFFELINDEQLEPDPKTKEHYIKNNRLLNDQLFTAGDLNKRILALLVAKDYQPYCALANQINNVQIYIKGKTKSGQDIHDADNHKLPKGSNDVSYLKVALGPKNSGILAFRRKNYIILSNPFTQSVPYAKYHNFDKIMIRQEKDTLFDGQEWTINEIEIKAGIENDVIFHGKSLDLKMGPDKTSYISTEAFKSNQSYLNMLSKNDCKPI